MTFEKMWGNRLKKVKAYTVLNSGANLLLGIGTTRAVINFLIKPTFFSVGKATGWLVLAVFCFFMIRKSVLMREAGIKPEKVERFKKIKKIFSGRKS